MIAQPVNRKSKRLKQVAVGFLLLCILAIVTPTSRRLLIKTWMGSLQSVRTWVKPLMPSADKQLSEQALLDEVARLRKISTDLVIVHAEYEQLKKENEELKLVVKYQAPSGFRKVTVHNLGRPAESLRAIAYIDAGQAEGLIKGAGVISPSGNLIGIIEDIREHSASVRLLFDARTKIAARIAGVDEANGIVMPVEGGALALRFLGENISVPKTSVIITTAIAGVLPAGLTIGTIETTSKEEETPFLRAIISSPERFDSLDFGVVLVP